MVLATVTATAQSEIKQSKRVVGQQQATAKDIEANVLEFDDVLYRCNQDGTQPGIVLQLREGNKAGTSLYSRGQLMYFDTQKSEMRWTRTVRYDEEALQWCGDKMMLCSPYSTSPINSNTGADEWVSSVLPFMTITGSNLMLGYKEGSLYGVDLTTGKNRWRRFVGANAGINDFMMKDDSTLLVMASGVHQLNVNSGYGWGYEAKMVSNDYTRSILTSVAGAAFGAFTGMYFYRIGADVLSQQCSNLLKESSSLYFASRDSLYKLNSSGKALWKTSWGRKASSSVLWMDSTQIYFLNLGIAKYNGATVKKSTTWLSACDKKNGQMKYCNFIGAENSAVMGYQKNKDSVDVFTSDRCVRFGLKNGAIRSANFDTVPNGPIHYMLDDKLFYQATNSGFQSLAAQNPTGYWLTTTRKEVVMLNHDFQRGQTVPLSSLFMLKGTYNGYLLLIQGDKTVIATPDGKLVAELSMGGDIIHIGNVLYGVDKRAL
ncbi:MAG: hypothetical protein RIS29_1369, partial [Bacteroidota bacterium]